MLSHRVQWLYLGPLAGALGFAVLRHGGRALFDWNISLLVVAVCAISYRLTTPVSRLAPAMEKLPRTLALLVPAYFLFQLVPLPMFLVRILSPERARILDSLRAVMPPVTFAPLSVSPAVTFVYLFRIIGYLLVFLLIRELASRSRRPWIVVIPLIVIAGLDAVLGLFQSAAGDAVIGTYWNHSHFAGLLEMVFPLAIACAVTMLQGDRSIQGAGAGRTLAAGAVLLSACLMLVAIVLSLSKGGFAACLGGLFFMAALAAVASIGGWKRWLILGLLGVLFLLLFASIPTDQLATSLGNSFSDKTGEGRVPIWRDSLHLLAAYPLTGSGLGTYETAFQKYQTVMLDYDIEFAHNDYLNFLTESGLLGFLILGGFVLTIFARTLRSGSMRSDPNTRYLAWGCAGAIAAIGLHSFTDFNMYIPANALVLAWIFGIAASLPSRSTSPSTSETPSEARIALALACILLIYAPACLVLEGKFRDNPQAEARFCRFGICDTDSVIESETARHGGSVAAVPVAELRDALRRDPADPFRWCDLGEAMLKSGQVEQARTCFSNALALAPNSPPLHLRAVSFYDGLHDRQHEFEQSSRLLEESALYDSQIFERYWQEKLPVADVLRSGLPPNQRAFQAWLRDKMRLGEFADAATVWDWILSHHYGDDKLAREYVGFLVNNRLYEQGAHAWANSLGDRRNDYLKSNWLYNGDFESEPSGTPFDWRIESPGDDVKVAIDATVSHTGSHSLRIQFGGKENVNYSHTSQTAFIKPGRYRFTAFVRTQGITTDKGIAFHIFDDSLSHQDVKTEQFVGTADWKKMEQTIVVPPGANLLTVQIVRPRSWREDSYIAGTVWIDTVSLSKL